MNRSSTGATRTPPVIDSHVHFWDPVELEYPWLTGVPRLRRRFTPEDLTDASLGAPLRGLIFVECNCAPEQAGAEVERVDALAGRDERILGIVAFADLTSRDTLHPLLQSYRQREKVRGIRHNIQGNEPGFCLREDFVEGVREAGRHGFTFDLCATHDQLDEVVELARRCPGTRLVLDHCGKPDIAGRRLDPWRAHVRQLADLPHVWCKISGLLTEADRTGWAEEDLVPYAEHVVECFGTDRVMYGGDWPVVTLAGTYLEWYQFTRRLTAEWTSEERAAFYGENALRFYGL